MEEASSGEEVEEESGGSGSEGENHDGGDAVRPYFALMKSFAESPANNAKRRKLAHSESLIERRETQDAAPPGVDVELELDRADEADEEAEHGSADDISDDEDQSDASDPFESHFAEPNEDEVVPRIQAIKGNEWMSTKSAAQKSRIVFTQPKTEGDGKALSSVPVSGPSDLKLKQRLHEFISSLRPEFDDLERNVAPLLFQYYDTLFCERNFENAESLRRLVCLHAVNHVFKYGPLFPRRTSLGL